MTDSSDLNALAERCEKEAAGSRELDAEIAITAGKYVRERRGNDRKEWFYRVGGEDYERRSANDWGTDGLPRYTTSLDAALTLVPEGMKIDLIRRDDGTGYACIWTPRGNRSNTAATPALALCAAALRALAATE